MIFNEKPGVSPQELASLGNADTIPGTGSPPKSPSLETTDPQTEAFRPLRKKEVVKHKKEAHEEVIDEAEKERLYRELEEYVYALHLEEITLETPIDEINRVLKEIKTNQSELDQKCEQMIKENKKQGETELSASNERGSQVLEGKVDEDILNLKIASIRCGTKIYSLKRILTLKKKLGDFKPQLSSELKHAA